MNKSKQPMNNKVYKKMGKEVRLAQGQPSPKQQAVESPIPFEQRLLQKLEKQTTTKGHRKKVSKRTTPGKKVQGTAPSSVHIEGKRWAKTTVVQSKAAGKRLTKKLSKQ